MTTIPLAPPLLAGSSDLPGDLDGPSNQRCSAGRLPIWSCSVRGFACHPCYHRRGALLPHLFTLTHHRPSGSGEASPLRGLPRRSTRSVRRRAVCFLCHFPSSHPDRALPGALPCGVRTFLPPSRGRPLAEPVSPKPAKQAKADGRLAHCDEVIVQRGGGRQDRGGGAGKGGKGGEGGRGR